MQKHKVTKCVCHQRSFEDIKAYADKHNITSSVKLQQERLCGCGCGMCLPYIDLVLESGETEFSPEAIYTTS